FPYVSRRESTADVNPVYAPRLRTNCQLASTAGEHCEESVLRIGHVTRLALQALTPSHRLHLRRGTSHARTRCACRQRTAEANSDRGWAPPILLRFRVDARN